VAVASLAQLAVGASHRQAGDRRRLASARFSPILDLESRQRTGRPGVPADVRALIGQLSAANPLWGAPRNHGERQKLGIAVSQSTVATFMRRRPTMPCCERRKHVSPTLQRDRLAASREWAGRLAHRCYYPPILNCRRRQGGQVAATVGCGDARA